MRAAAQLLGFTSLLLLLLVSLVWTFSATPQPDAGSETVIAARGIEHLGDCRVCHEQTHQEWESSRHAMAWSSRITQDVFQSFGNDRRCQACHAPPPILGTDGYVSPHAPRVEHRDRGVDCAVCHLTPSGIVARHDRPDVPCQPRHDVRLLSSQSCGTCHEKIFEDWSGSSWAATSRTCVTCHMPSTADHGPSHLIAARDPVLIERSVRIDLESHGAAIIAKVTNHGVGHNFPGERHHRELFIELRQIGKDGHRLRVERQKIKGVIPFRGETSTEKIAAGETIPFSFDRHADAVSAEAELVLRFYPWQSDAESLFVCQKVLNLEPTP